MKKFLVFVSAISLILCVCGFTPIRNKATALYVTLNTTIQEKKAEAEAKAKAEAEAKAKKESDEAKTEDSVSESQEEHEYTTEELDALIASKNYEDWNTVALNANASAQQLQTIAKNCINLTDNKKWVQTITDSICNNENCDENVINELLNSDYHSILNIVAKSDKANPVHLVIIAKKCAAITDSSAWAEAIATTIDSNGNTDDSVMKELANSQYYEVIQIVVSSSNTSEQTLLSLAKRCATITDNKSWAQNLATHIANNDIATDTIMNELANSCYNPVLNIVAKSKHSGAIALQNVAKKCAAITDNQTWAQTIATSICDNDNVTADILFELTNSQFYSILNTVLESSHSDARCLQTIAKKCAAITDNKNWAQNLATTLSNNNAATDEIMYELTNSTYYSILNIVAKSKHSGTTTLQNTAKKCAAITDNENWAQTIAKNISNNDNCTPDILNLLSTSSYPSVAKLSKAEN